MAGKNRFGRGKTRTFTVNDTEELQFRAVRLSELKRPNAEGGKKFGIPD